MSSSISTQLDGLGKSLALLDAGMATGDGQLGSSDFLDAVDSLLVVFDTVGVDVLEGGRNDMAENVSKIRNAVQRFSGSCPHLQSLVEAERAAGQGDATEALTWLARGLQFYTASVQRFTGNGSEKLADSIIHAYKDTLKKHHGFVAKTAIKVAVSKTCPTRDEMFGKLGQDPAMVMNALQGSATTFQRVLGILEGNVKF